jgi:hypothetical protein
MSGKTETPNVATAVTAVQVRQGEEGAFTGWLTRLNKTIATFPGYISAVVIPPVPPLQSDWVMVQRFQTIEELRVWLDSDARPSLLDESASLLVDEGTTNVIQGTNTELSPHDMVTEIITVGVKPGMEEAYRDWVDRIRQVEAKFPGCQGLQLQPLVSRTAGQLGLAAALRYCRAFERLARVRCSPRRLGGGPAVHR